MSYINSGDLREGIDYKVVTGPTQSYGGESYDTASGQKTFKIGDKTVILLRPSSRDPKTGGASVYKPVKPIPGGREDPFAPLTPPAPPTPEAAVSDTEVKVNADGIEQKGRNLSSVNALFGRLIDQGQMAPGTQIGQPNKYLSAYLPGTAAGEEQLKAPVAEKPASAPQERSEDTDYSAVDAKTMGRSTEDNLKIAAGGSVETVIEPTVPGTTGQSDDPQEGKSDTPDRADRVRRIQEATSNVKATYTPSDRERARAAFLDPRNKGYAAIRARDAAVGADLGGIGGAEFKDGMSRDARFALSGGEADSEKGAQEFAAKYLKQVAGVARESEGKGIAGSVDPTTGKPYKGPAF